MDQNSARAGFKIHERAPNFDNPSLDHNFMHPLPDPVGLSLALTLGEESSPSSDTFTSSGGSLDSPSDDNYASDPLLGCIREMLMEENDPQIAYDPTCLKATEKSLYEILGDKFPPPPPPPPPPLQSPNPFSYDDDISGTGDSVDPQSVSEFRSFNTSFLETSLPSEYNFQSKFKPGVQFSENTSNNMFSDGLLGFSASELVKNMFSNQDSMLQFKKGLEEASKFLPSTSQLVIDLGSNREPDVIQFRRESEKASEKFLPRTSELVIDFGNKTVSNVVKEEISAVDFKKRTQEERLSNRPWGCKNHEREDLDVEEGRRNKQSAVYVEENAQDQSSELFDKVMLWNLGEETRDDQYNGSNSKTHARKQSKKKETVDLEALLILCAQATSANDLKTANDCLNRIRQHSSPVGDGSQRLAHYFANALEARLSGSSGSEMQNFFTSITSRKETAANLVKAHKTLLSAAPFKKLSILFGIKMILRAAEKAKTVHVLDFGIFYGFQWPMLIQQLSLRPQGPPKLRITGIELPQKGFRPAQRIEDTGRCLAKYCARFNVPFEYNAISSQHWEKIPIGEFKLQRNEVLAVNCMCRLKSLLDETGDADCPRDAALKLIREMNPDIFVHTIINGSYNSPFFLTRFREALFHFSSLFDMFDTNLLREDEERLRLEIEFFGREAMNVITCEGAERVERPETYKQWQARTTKAGFKQLPFDRKLVDELRNNLNTKFHKDFSVNEKSNWMLQAWKGRIIYASTCWVPA